MSNHSAFPHKSMVSITHEQNVICRKTQLDSIAHGQTIICSSHGLLLANEKEGQNASNDNAFHFKTAVWVTNEDSVDSKQNIILICKPSMAH